MRARKPYRSWTSPTSARTSWWARPKNLAVTESERIVTAARSEAANEKSRARDALRKDVAALALAGATKVLGREVDAKAHAQLLDELAAELEKQAPSHG